MKYAGLFTLGLFTIAVQAQWSEESDEVFRAVDAAVEDITKSAQQYDVPRNTQIRTNPYGGANRAFYNNNRWYRNGRKRR
jgi:hypothetical protein